MSDRLSCRFVNKENVRTLDIGVLSDGISTIFM